MKNECNCMGSRCITCFFCSCSSSSVCVHWRDWAWKSCRSSTVFSFRTSCCLKFDDFSSSNPLVALVFTRLLILAPTIVGVESLIFLRLASPRHSILELTFFVIVFCGPGRDTMANGLKLNNYWLLGDAGSLGNMVARCFVTEPPLNPRSLC